MSQNTDYQTSNYPADGDSTASGGYGSTPENTWSSKAQRGSNEAGLIDQSVNGGLVGDEIQDAVQGQDASTREQFAHDAKRDFGTEGGGIGLNPYGRNPDSRKETEDLLASKYTDARGRDYEGGASAGDA
ncbi:hypothetical protein BDW22DRAFT_1425721 [Trametopsis cervina]|nr:hypothetical protein BDW22DRAFT_1425721 [Trametopsis cervina]